MKTGARKKIIEKAKKRKKTTKKTTRSGRGRQRR